MSSENLASEKRERRAKSIASMGLVNRDGNLFLVTTPSLRGLQTVHSVERDEGGSVTCDCDEFAEGRNLDLSFRCEHILAVKYALEIQNVKTEENKVEGTKQASYPAPEEELKVEIPDFGSALRELRKNVDPHLVKQREGWRDRNGNVQMVDYVEWHTVADILDNIVPDWQHHIKDIREIGNIMTVTVAITIDGITREGIGTGAAQSELGIKKAEHDALKRAAVKFGIARDLYKKESEVIERDGSAPQNSDEGGFPSNPVARTLGDLVTAKQLGMIRAIAREIGVDPDEECNEVMNCKTDELSKKAASSLIQHLQDMQRQGGRAL
jgi:hypothetical protein